MSSFYSLVFTFKIALLTFNSHVIQLTHSGRQPVKLNCTHLLCGQHNVKTKGHRNAPNTVNPLQELIYERGSPLVSRGLTMP